MVSKAMKWSISLSFSCSMGATGPASPSQHHIINRALLVKSACFPNSSRLHPRVTSDCVFENSTLWLSPFPPVCVPDEDVPRAVIVFNCYATNFVLAYFLQFFGFLFGGLSNSHYLFEKCSDSCNWRTRGRPQQSSGPRMQSDSSSRRV